MVFRNAFESSIDTIPITKEKALGKWNQSSASVVFTLRIIMYQNNISLPTLGTTILCVTYFHKQVGKVKIKVLEKTFRSLKLDAVDFDILMRGKTST